MSPEGVCHCGHERFRHQGAKERCGQSIDNAEDPFAVGATWLTCPCRRFDNSVLPADGERLEFGRHRIRAAEAESAPAWPPLEPPAR